jgi:CRISPR/Cas system CSM-associated protein Csm3 (group 7 of RAMP superfamily)
MSGRAKRGVVERVLINGTLWLETPTHFGNGDVVGLTDMPLLRDPQNGAPLLTGASIAGALRSYLREYEGGYGASSGRLADRLFGQVKGHISSQSWLLMDDALGTPLGVELRDGVAIDTVTRTAEDKKKYDIELLQAGTMFPLAFELLLTEDNQDLLAALGTALHGLEAGEIGLGQRKRRGLGQCSAGNWRVRHYKLTTPEGLIGWLADDRTGEKMTTDDGRQDIMGLLGVKSPVTDARRSFEIEATFQLTSSLLIRSGSGKAADPDMVHLTSRRNDEDRPILSGTSLAGAVRSRALRIANTVLGSDPGHALVDDMFGKSIEGHEDKPTGSRVITRESELIGTRDLVQSRVKIDRFTGGSFPTALFTEQPAFGGDDAQMTIHLALRQPADAEVGLLLLVLKDLWTGDLPLGGESSVGRGRLRGQRATLTSNSGSKPKTWVIAQADDRLNFGGDGQSDELEDYVRALLKHGQSDDRRIA